MKHYAMATDEAFRAASDPAGTTVADGLAPGGSISGVYGVIERKGETAVAAQDDHETPQNTDSNGLSIVQDNDGNFYLVGQAGLEPATKAL